MSKALTTLKKPTSEFICSFCNKEYQTENRLISHLCEKKRRWINRDEKYVKLGFLAYQQFYEKTKMRKVDYEHFMKSNFYTAFTRFGRHIMDIGAIEPHEFIKFVLDGCISIDHWCKDQTYEEYVRYLTAKEPAHRALERNILLMQQWAMDHDMAWTEFFNQVTTPLAVKLIRQGRLSPWLLYNCDTAQNLISRMSDEQMVLVYEYINPILWKQKFKKNKEDVEFIKEISVKAGI